jgi:hypothetical protein
VKVFISWSGEKSASQEFAEGLADWLQSVLPQVRPFYSTEDIKKGQHWFEKIAQELEAADFGILALTPSNAGSTWISFEAGAIAKKIGRGKVVPIVLGMPMSDLKPPLAMFNGAVPTEEDMLRVVRSINEELAEQKLEDARLVRTFAKWWPDLQKVIVSASEKLKKAPETKTERRSVEDILQEILGLLRGQARTESPSRDEISRLYTGLLANIAGGWPPPPNYQAADRRMEMVIESATGLLTPEEVRAIVATWMPTNTEVRVSSTGKISSIRVFVPALVPEKHINEKVIPAMHKALAAAADKKEKGT